MIEIKEVLHKCCFPNESLEDYNTRMDNYAESAKGFLFAKADIMKEMQKIQDQLFKRYNIATNEKLSKGVRRLILNSIR